MAGETGQFVIFASELASAIGKHKYSPRSETLCKLWRRNHEPSFCFVHAIVLENDVKKIILNDYESCTKFKISEENQLWFVDAVRKIVLGSDFRSLYKKILKLVDLKVFEAARENRILAEKSHIVELMERQIKILCQDESKTVEEALEEICQKTGVQAKEIQKAVKSKLTKDRGTHLEQTAVQSFVEGKGIEFKPVAKPKLYYKNMECKEVKWRVCGKIDAQMGDEIIEVKNRRNRFMYPIYDYIQLQTYLFLCDKTRGILLERLHGQNRETACPFDEKFWLEEITPELRKFVIELSKHIETGKEMLYGKSKALSPRKRNCDEMETEKEKQDDVRDLSPKNMALGLGSNERPSSLATCNSKILETPEIKQECKIDDCVVTTVASSSKEPNVEPENDCQGIKNTLPCFLKEQVLKIEKTECETPSHKAAGLPSDFSEEIEEPMSPVY